MIKQMVSGLLLLGLAACASNPPSRLQVDQAYLNHAGADVERVRYSGLVKGWRPVGEEAVLLWFNHNRYYLFDLTAPCHQEVRFARRIGVRATTPGVLSRFDRLDIGGLSCRIVRIRELDHEAARAEIDALGEQSPDARREVEVSG